MLPRLFVIGESHAFSSKLAIRLPIFFDMSPMRSRSPEMRSAPTTQRRSTATGCRLAIRWTARSSISRCIASMAASIATACLASSGSARSMASSAVLSCCSVNPPMRKIFRVESLQLIIVSGDGMGGHVQSPFYRMAMRARRTRSGSFSGSRGRYSIHKTIAQHSLSRARLSKRIISPSAFPLPLRPRRPPWRTPRYPGWAEYPAHARTGGTGAHLSASPQSAG